MDNFKTTQLSILNQGYQGSAYNYRRIPNYILRQLRSIENLFPRESRKLEWQFSTNPKKITLVFWDNGHLNHHFLVNHLLPCIDNNGYQELNSKSPKIIIYINK